MEIYQFLLIMFIWSLITIAIAYIITKNIIKKSTKNEPIKKRTYKKRQKKYKYNELKKLRVSAGFSQYELAEKLGLAQKTISRVERGLSTFRMTKIVEDYLRNGVIPANVKRKDFIQWRIDNDIPVTHIARQLKISGQTIHNYELGRKISKANINRINEYFYQKNRKNYV